MKTGFAIAGFKSCEMTSSYIVRFVMAVIGHSLWTRPARVQSPWEVRIIRCKNWALYIRDCESLCLSDETVTAVGPFSLVSMLEYLDKQSSVNS